MSAEARLAPGVVAPDVAAAVAAPLLGQEVHLYIQVTGTVALEPRDCDMQQQPFAVWHQSDLHYREVLATEPPEPNVGYRYVRPEQRFAPSMYDDAFGYDS